MSDLPRITPTSGMTIPPVRPTRKVDRAPQRKPARDPKSNRREADPEEELDAEDHDGGDDPNKGKSINLRV